MKIRDEQKEAFSEAAVRRFEDGMVVHLGKFFPEHCKALGEPKVRKAIGYGIERAKTYGVVTERDVCKYVNLMFAFGQDFDTDDRMPWAGEILNDEAYQDPTARINRVYSVAKAHVRHAVSQQRQES